MAKCHDDLYKYQKTGARFIAAREGALLLDEMGVGKSAQIIGGADEAGAKSGIILVPGIARTNWKREFERFQTMDRSVGVIEESSRLPDTDIVIAPYHLLANDRVLPYLFSRKWDIFAADEAQFLKNPTATRTRVTYGLDCDAKTGLLKRCRQKWVASGTIMPSNASELWSHSNAVLGPAVTKGRNYSSWVDRYCVKRRNSEKIIKNSPAVREELVGLLRPYSIRRLAKDVLKDLPPLRFNQIPLRPDKMPPKSRELQETEIIIEGALAKQANGNTAAAQEILQTVDSIHLATLRKWTGIAKAYAVAEYLRYELENGLDKALVFAIHKEPIEIIANHLPDCAFIHGGVVDTKTIKRRQNILDGFQGLPGVPPIRNLVVSIDIASTALTLTSCARAAFAECPWIPKDIEQAVKRLHRNGQTRPVNASMFSLAGSIDEVIAKTVLRKYEQVSGFNSAMVS